MQMHLQEKVISLRLIIIRNGEDMLLINFPLDKLSSVLADTGQIPDSLSHLGPFKEDVSSNCSHKEKYVASVEYCIQSFN